MNAPLTTQNDAKGVRCVAMPSTGPWNRERGGARRLVAALGPVLLGTFVLASCGSAENGATRTTVDLSASSTAFVTLPPATTVPESATADSADSVDPEERVEGTQDYEVQSGDYPLKLVNDFGITLDDLLGINEWESANEFPGPGTIIKIPPNARSVAAVAAGTATEEEDTAESEDDATPSTTTPIPDAGDNCDQGTYTIVEGDYEGKVAGNFDVTVDALRAANANTPGYSAFYVGLEIVIPAKTDC